ncbi:phosphonate C-P lyase system protein PhnH [Magnetospira thiophila]
MNVMTETPIAAGFDSPVFGATACFRVILDALSRPATLRRLPLDLDAPAGLRPGTVAVLLTLADHDTPVWLAPGCDTAEARAYLRFHVGCPMIDTPSRATFAVLTPNDDLSALDALPLGTSDYPDRSATVILQAETLAEDDGPTFTGPGIEIRHRLQVLPTPDGLWTRVAANHALFPCGLDWLFTTDTHLAAVPRSSALEI